MTTRKFIFPEWPAPLNIRACTSLRYDGKSQGCYQSFNLADHVGDDPECVRHNRQLLKESLQLPNEPAWLEQTHSSRVVRIDMSNNRHADAAVSFKSENVCVILTADCLPILFCDRNGTRVAAVHAGWKGLSGGIITTTLEALQCPAEELLVWLGPAIGPNAYQVGDDVRDVFLSQGEQYALAFLPDNLGRWMANLYYIALLQLKDSGVKAIYGGIYCSYTDTERFFSFRRNNQTGRMASLIWMQET